MNEASITQYIIDTFEGIHTVTADGNSFFFYDPDRKFPFATLVTNDDYDSASNLNRSSVFRLNIGISKQTFRSLFGAETPSADGGGGAGGRYDFAALDRLLPHPVDGRMNWVCVLNPSASTFQSLRPLLAEAYGLSVRRYNRGPPEEET
jgi:uncharacterized protein DUF6194